MGKQGRRGEIARLLEVRDREGLTYEELSARCGLARSTLSWWAWRLRKDACRRDAFVELETAESEHAPEVIDEAIELLCGAVTIRVPARFDAVALGRVLDVLERRC